MTNPNLGGSIVNCDPLNPLTSEEYPMIKEAFALSNRSYVPLIKSSYGVLLPLWILSELLNQYFDFCIKVAQRGGIDQIIAQLGQLATSITVSFVLILLLPIRLHDWQNKRPYQEWAKIVSQHSWPLFVEGLRMTGHILMWAILFVVPGLYKQIRYIFVPFVVLFDPEYKNGKVDALSQSSELTKGVFWILTGIFVASFSAELLFKMNSKIFPWLAHPIFQFITGGLTFLVTSYFYSVFYFIFSLQIKRQEISKKQST